jgi:hypothetical protein
MIYRREDVCQLGFSCPHDEVAQRVRYDVRYRYFVGSHRPDFRTLNRFRKDQLDLLPGYFAALVDHCEAWGLIDSSVVALDELASPAGQSIYARRRVLVEPVFGHFKHNLGFTCFSLRGLAKVKGEFLLLCIAHNLKKLARWSADGRGLTPLRTVLRRLWACIVRRITHSRTFWFTMTTNQPMTATV